MIRNILVPVTRKWYLPESALCKEIPMSFKLLLQLGFTCSTAADELRFILSDSQFLWAFNRSFSVFFLVVFTPESGNLLTYMKNIHFSSSLERPTETSRRNTASRHRDNVHVYDKWPVWGYFRVDQPTSTCFKWHTSITVYLQRTSDRSNSHERRCSTRNLDDMHTIWGICL